MSQARLRQLDAEIARLNAGITHRSMHDADSQRLAGLVLERDALVKPLSEDDIRQAGEHLRYRLPR